MNTLRLSIGRLSTGACIGLGVLLFSTVGLLMVKMLGVSFIHFAGFVLFLSTAALVSVTARMVTTGKIRAKGAKKRRKRLLPMVYKKKRKVTRLP
jgi:hypothetical protein